MLFNTNNPPIKSSFFKSDITDEREMGLYWVVIHRADTCTPCPDHPAGTLVCDPAPPGTDESLTFTAPNGKRYMDTRAGSRWLPHP